MVTLLVGWLSAAGCLQSNSKPCGDYVRLDTWTLSYRNVFAFADRCIAESDTDGDGLKGCADPDCWARCAPANPPCVSTAMVSCPSVSGSYCGDGVCNQELEGWLLCALDCAAP